MIKLAAIFSSALAIAGCGSEAPMWQAEGKGPPVSGHFPEAQSTQVGHIEAREVMIGHDGPDFDACGAVGQVVNLKPDGDNFLAVRSAPSVSAKRIDTLGPDQIVWMCDHVEGWHGIVYEGSEDQDCQTSSPVDSYRAYDGPCKAGWVSDRYIQLIAG